MKCAARSRDSQRITTQFSLQREMAGVDEPCEIIRLSKDCISHVISLTSPADSCRSAVVSTMFRSAAESDTVWECFLPTDYKEIVSWADDPMEFSSKKELYFRLSNSILIDRGKKSFSLERSTGRKCYTLSARELEIFEGDTPHHWKWKHIRESRFPEVVELLCIWWLEIKGRMDCKVLSRRTNYAAYLIFKLSPKSYGFWDQLATVSLGSQSSSIKVSITPWQTGGNRAPNSRLDGWMEMELGEFFNGDGDDGNVEMRFFETYAGKGGLIIEGIELRPK